jgi:hypothetical protein
MDSRLRGNDGIRSVRLGVLPGDSGVIPAQAGIHLEKTEKSKKILYTYLDDRLKRCPLSVTTRFNSYGTLRETLHVWHKI